MPAKLVYRNKEGRPTTFDLTDEGASIGRGERNSIRLISNTVSSNHCRIVCTDGAWFVEDLGSTNGTMVNKKRVPKNGRSALAHTDMLSCGALQLQFFNEPEERSEAASGKDVGALWQELDKITESLFPDAGSGDVPAAEQPLAAAPAALAAGAGEELAALRRDLECEAGARRAAEERAADLERRLAEAASYQQTSIELDKKLRGSTSEVEELRRRTEHLEQRLRQAEQVVEQLRQQLGQADAGRRASEQAVEELRKKLGLIEAQRHAAEVRAQDASDRARRLEAEAADAQREIARLRFQQAALAAPERREERIRETEVGLLEFREERSQILGSYERSRRQLSRLRSEMERLRLLISE